MRKRIGSLIATKFLLLSANAVAHPSGTTSSEKPRQHESQPDPLLDSSSSIAPRTLFAIADTNRDGSVSFGELATVVNSSIARRLEKRFRQLDLNHDGRCTLAEVNKMSAARFARFDLDGNGHFTLGELTTAMKRAVSTRLNELRVILDRNRDGRFSLAELVTTKPSPQKVAERAPAPRKSVEVAKRSAVESPKSREPHAL
jgi:Ca2+-binding EF-hand superfamily protein